MVLAGGAGERDCDFGATSSVWLGDNRYFHSPARSRTMERNSSVRGEGDAILISSASGRSPGGLVRLSLLEDGLPAGQPRICSLQRSGHAQSAAHSSGSGDEALATVRIFRSLSADDRWIAGHVSSAAERRSDTEWHFPSSHCILGASRVSFRDTRLSGFHV